MENADQPSEPSRAKSSPNSERRFDVVTYEIGNGKIQRDDQVVIEEPVEIRIVFGPAEKRMMRNVSITMRTPGNDHELAVGFLLSESILSSPGQIKEIQSTGTDAQGLTTGNIVRVEAIPGLELDLGRLQRHFFTTSSCGVCGKASLEALEIQGLLPIQNDGFKVSSSQIHALSDRLRDQQKTFERTGGLHAAGLFDANGTVVASREDVGRHNAVDKLIGRYFLDGQTPLSNFGMIVSGRVSFEIMQKALAGRISMIVAVGAPSSLAIEMAEQYNMTLVGFASADRFNVYSNTERIIE